MTQSGVLLPLSASGQEWDKSDITISNKLSARYQRRRRTVDRCSLATPPRAQYDGKEYEALPVKPKARADLASRSC
jgi:hypothetical protein